MEISASKMDVHSIEPQATVTPNKVHNIALLPCCCCCSCCCCCCCWWYLWCWCCCHEQKSSSHIVQPVIASPKKLCPSICSGALILYAGKQALSSLSVHKRPWTMALFSILPTIHANLVGQREIFGEVESRKERLKIADYSITQASLEHVT